MQYKIPVQIENEDPIVAGLSLRQLTILLIGFGIAYSIFNGLTPIVGNQIAAAPAIIVALLAVIIALFKNHEMTFVPFVLSLLRLNINEKKRKWCKGVDSFQKIDIGYIVANNDKKEKKDVDFKSKIDKINDLNDKINKI